MNRRIETSCLAVAAFLLAGLVPSRAEAMTDCEMTFHLTSWSIFYKPATGSGTTTCDHGQRASVRLSAKGGGLTAGRSKIRDGYGKFSEVASISELFGDYVSAGASAGAVRSAESQALTKGEVSLA